MDEVNNNNQKIVAEVASEKRNGFAERFHLAHRKSIILKFVDSTWGAVTGVVATLGGGAVVAVDQVHKAAFKVFSGHEVKVFKDLQDKRDYAIGAAVQKTLAGQPIDMVEEVRKHNRQYALEVTRRREQLGISGVFNEWRILRPHQRKEAVMTAAAATAIALGAVIAIATAREGSLEQEAREKGKDSSNLMR